LCIPNRFSAKIPWRSWSRWPAHMLGIMEARGPLLVTSFGR
jgi:hypothetical protein